MLGKLIKYDMKALNRFLIIMHAFLLLTAFLVRWFITGQITLNNLEDGTLLGLAVLVYSLLITGISYGTLILIAVRFYKNLFSDEGYLSHTLPVTSAQHLLSKTISGSIWAFIDSVLIFTALGLMTFTPELCRMYQENKSMFWHFFGFSSKDTSSLRTLLLLLIILTVVGAVANVILIYSSIALGQLFSSHRVLGAVVVYFALTTVLAMISFVVMAIFGASSVPLSGAAQPPDLSALLMKTFQISCILSLISTVILYIITSYILKKKVNLV